jgi:hypothetical protein
VETGLQACWRRGLEEAVGLLRAVLRVLAFNLLKKTHKSIILQSCGKRRHGLFAAKALN